MSYSPPGISLPVVLSTGYAAPAIATPVILGDGAQPALGGYLAAVAAAPVPDASLSAAGCAIAPAALVAIADVVAPVASAILTEAPRRAGNSLWAVAPPEAPPATFRALERAYVATLVVTAPAVAPPVSIAGQGATLYPATTAVAIAAPTVAATLTAAGSLDIALPDNTAGGVASRYRNASAVAAAGRLAHAQAVATRTRAVAPHAETAPIAARAGVRHAEMLRASRAGTLPHQHSLPTQRRTRHHHAETLGTRRQSATPHAHGLPVRMAAGIAHADTIVRRPRLRHGWQHGLPTADRLAIGYHAALPAALRLDARWQHGEHPAPGRWWPTYEPPGLTIVLPCSGGYIPRSLACPVVLGPGYAIQPPCHVDPGGGTVIVPVRRTYIVLNNVSLRRVSNNLQLPAISLQIDIDADSWGWGWSASLPGNQLDNLDRDAPAVPVELEAQVNGVLWRLLVERIGTDRRFGQHRLSISGRGIAAELADPIYPAESRDNTAGAMTAQQLADAALTSNGVPLGWTLDWQIADWLVPAGAWVHTGTPMDAVTRIASAAGGYVQADPLSRILHVLPRYPLLPWEWSTATPGLILPSAVTTREAVEYLDMPEYNRVYVSGGDIGGVLGQVTIAGSAGDLPAEMVVDALITHVDAVRGRGTAILGNTGRQQRMTLETPILPDVGLYTVGTLLEWQEGADTRRGLVRAVGVSAAHPRVRQSIEVECHG